MTQNNPNPFSLLFHYLPVGIFYQDASGKIKEANPRYCETLGIKETKSANRHWLEFVTANNSERVSQLWQKTVIGRNSADISCELTKETGNTIWAEINAKPVYNAAMEFVGYAGFISDVTNKIMFDKVLERFKKAVEKTDAQVIFTDAEGIVLYANEAVEKITGFTSGEVIGQKAGKIWGGLMDKEFYAKLWDTIKTKKSPFEAEVINRKKSGESYFADINITPVLDARGDVEFYVGIEKDTTYTKEVDRVKNEFISIASHQLRTPLSSIRWLTELLMHDNSGQLDAEHTEMVSKIHSENERLIKLVNSLLTVSRAEAGKIEITPILLDSARLLTKLLVELTPLIKAKNQTVEVQSPSEPLTFFADEKLVYEALKNLVTNSVKYTPEGGRIWLRIKKEGEFITFVVTDNGVGIPTNEQHRVFQKFFRASNIAYKSGEGSGLGLFFVRWVAYSHNGKVWFESEENVGTTFYLSFPIGQKT
ncbi:MAG: NarL family signal transduction histidine kinase [candidate division WWE3 bacterium GW2011_GWC2_44_9]|uniref:histidine kinase n=2 Tax=Katanobacteria TaxID=422282 RepID=A0A0G1KIE9_UNCKA|nr:MAG: NarL family signal transduction histidine kinase [candidate division WWE3 bacterium GW2011_GWC2_44_9]OGC52549.1 MAG: hypothetical protein A2709_02435 [candidate division WWE3 bacterium RIFCSPHIGHO2_01_FULL_43_9]